MNATDPVSEIQSLLARLAHLADDGTVEEYLSNFTADAVWQSSANPATGMAAQSRVGVAEIEAGVRARRASGIQGPGTATRHVLSTVAVTASGGDEATATAYWTFYVETTSAPRLSSVGRYDDVLRREHGSWRLARRVVTMG
ncbi:nuclear transport factor 2 family protein [Rhodococcus spelaei]|uniref:nuclear transport factor 2 family protein n=1 Tax=Rhodococcus spelaei TaxID=2546320 RepID=UPI001FEB9817|nr:nuclear transport factor 2 family protein [Rhodococcus spelaei]